MATVTGTPFEDTLFGTYGDDSLYGFALNDELWGRTGNDYLDGGAGTDTLHGGLGNDFLVGELDGDFLYGNSGNDILQLNSPVYHGGSSGWGGDGDDILLGFDTGDVWADGGKGIDTLGLFWLDGTAGPGAHVDLSPSGAIAVASNGSIAHFKSIERLFLMTDVGDDTIVGGKYDDQIHVGEGANEVHAKAGNDTVSYTLGEANTLDGGGGMDWLEVNAGTSPVYFVVDTYDGTVDDGQLSTIYSFEHYSVAGSSSADTISLGNRTDDASGFDGQDTIFGMGGRDTLYGGNGEDHLIGGDGADLLYGERDNDVLEGDAGNDRLSGGNQQDELYGGDGDDRLLGGNGQDTLTGGDGADLFIFNAPADGWDLITDFTSGEDQIQILAAQLGVFAPPLGQLQPEDLPAGGLRTDAGIFVLVYDAVTDQTDLQWTDNGFGTFSLMRFSGDISLSASDIFLI